ncbi:MULTISPECIES: hypothetical protein [unclassified Microbacterium]|uniref:hypothetical protein n=1 Tax=unclassified Microbacterium TaxID=2609290 RepID=UPI00386C0B2A
MVTQLAATGLVIVCELDDVPPENRRPSLHIGITQYLRLSDGSMIRLDMDRGLSSFAHGHSRPVSWKRSAADVIEEILTIVKADDPDPESLPWDEHAEAARLRGIDVDASVLRELPHTVLLSDDLARIFTS